jgi:hypothetical protein
MIADLRGSPEKRELNASRGFSGYYRVVTHNHGGKEPLDIHEVGLLSPIPFRFPFLQSAFSQLRTFSSSSDFHKCHKTLSKYFANQSAKPIQSEE